MGIFNKRNELEYVENRIMLLQRQISGLIEENKQLQEEIIDERKEYFLAKKQLEIDRGMFDKDVTNAFRCANSEVEHLTAELEFIKKYRMLPEDCKFYSTPPKVPRMMKKLKNKR